MEDWSDAVRNFFGGIQAAASSLGSAVQGAAEWTFWHTLWLVLAVGLVFLLAIVFIKSCNKKDQHLVENRSFAETAREESVVSDQSHEQKPKVRMTRSFVSTDYDEFGDF